MYFRVWCHAHKTQKRDGAVRGAEGLRHRCRCHEQNHGQRPDVWRDGGNDDGQDILEAVRFVQLTAILLDCKLISLSVP